jgi:cyanophycinase
MPQRSPGRGRGDSVRPLYADPAPPMTSRRQPANPGLAPRPNRPAPPDQEPGQSQPGTAPHLGQPGRTTGPRPVQNSQTQTGTYQTASHTAAASPARTPQKVISLAQQLAARPVQLRPVATPPPATTEETTAGPLLVIGGSEQMHAPSDTILSRFVELAGGQSAHIVVIATASSEPQIREVEYQRVFTRLGAGRVTPLRLDDREHASSPDSAAAIMTATGVFFTGGDQRRITTVLGGSRVDSVLHSRVAEGMVVAGTSAGAAMMSGTMIIGGTEATVSTDAVRTAPGLEFLPGVLIDMHFAARGRLNRLLSAVAMYPHELGLGIDEDTAILVTGDKFEVLGAGSVTVIDAGPAARIGTPADGDGPIAVYGMALHVLPEGHQFHLTGRRPLPPGVHPEGA